MSVKRFALRIGRSGRIRSHRSFRDKAILRRTAQVAGIGSVLIAGGLLAVPNASAATPTTVTFSYNGTDGSDGSAQYWTVPAGVYSATFDVFGAQGGGAGGGQGSEATAAIAVTPGAMLQVNVGGTPTQEGPGGFNGGGASGGGGASDVRQYPFGLSDRIIVGGGGGGNGVAEQCPSGGGNCSTVEDGQGGLGGGSTGGAGLNGSNGAQGGGYGTQTTGGLGGNGCGISFGGQNGNGLDGTTGAGGGGGTFGGEGGGGGGGGGYFGGGGGGASACGTSGTNIILGGGGGGGGGSGFGPSGVIFRSGLHNGNGVVNITYTPSVADTAISIGANPSPVAAGANLTYSVTVANAGPDTARDVTVQDTLPSASGFVGETSSQGSCIQPASGSTGTMTCSLGTIADGAVATISVVVNVKAPAGQSVSDTVSVSTGSIDPNPANNTATVTTYVLSPIPTTTSLASSANPSVYGQPVTFTATITPSSGSGTPSGSVTFTDGSSVLGTVALSGGRAALTTSSLAAGSHNIGARYSGDSTYIGSSVTFTQMVNKAPTKLSAAPASKATQRFSATLTRADNGNPISGQTVVFSTRNPVTGAQDTVCSAVTATNGVAACSGTVPTLDRTVDTSYTGTYTGNPNYLGSSATGSLS